MWIENYDLYLMWRWVDGHPECFTVQADTTGGNLQLKPTRTDRPGFLLTEFKQTPDPKEVPGYE